MALPTQFTGNSFYKKGRRRQWRWLAALCGSLAMAVAAQAQDTIIHVFQGGATDGAEPYGDLTLSSSLLYGMTSQGGSNNAGVIFRAASNGSGYTVLHQFSSASDGSSPRGTLTISGATLYGLTLNGGPSNEGTLFKMNTDGSGFGLLHSFSFGNNDGYGASGSLTLSGSTLYGVTGSGGNIGGQFGGSGTVFKINTDGTGYTILRTFTGGAGDGSDPSNALTISGTKTYGTTVSGGGSGSFGTLFIMNTDGTGFALLHSFNNTATEGYQPEGALTLIGSRLYGTALAGGSANNGTIFSINTDGTGFTVLHAFTGGANDGREDVGSLTFTNGNCTA